MSNTQFWLHVTGRVLFNCIMQPWGICLHAVPPSYLNVPSHGILILLAFVCMPQSTPKEGLSTHRGEFCSLVIHHNQRDCTVQHSPSVTVGFFSGMRKSHRHPQLIQKLYTSVANLILSFIHTHTHTRGGGEESCSV